MPRNKRQRNGTSYWHKGTIQNLSLSELQDVITRLVASEYTLKDKNSRKALRQSRAEYEAELNRRMLIAPDATNAD